MDAAAQLDALQPVQDEQRALDAPQLAQGYGQAILARLAAELAQPQRTRHRALLDRKSVVLGKSVSIRVDLGVLRNITKKPVKLTLTQPHPLYNYKSHST